MAQKRKPESSRLNLLYIIQVLKTYSDENHPLSVKEIWKKINQEYGYLSCADQFMSMDTIKRTLEDLLVQIFQGGLEMIEVQRTYGFGVYCVIKDGNKYKSYFPGETPNNPKKYYYYESSLTMAEIRTLIDAMETYGYFSEEDVSSIINKLIRLRPRSFSLKNYYDKAARARDENSLLLMNVDLLSQIIARKHCARITYCSYNMEKKLTVRKGYPRKIEPLFLMWSNGYYYLLAYNEKYHNTTNFRIDRITEIEELEINVQHILESFNPVQYRFEHPVMYGGRKEHFVLLCRDTGYNHIMNTIVDVFGKMSKVTEAPDELLLKYLGKVASYYKKQGITWLKVEFDSSSGGVELWATQYCNDCLIIAPKISRKRVRERLKEGMKNYCD